MNIIAVLFALSLPLGFGIVIVMRNASSIVDDGDFEIDLDDDMCLFHWRTDCPCFSAPVAIADVHDPFEIVLPFRERIEPPEWVDAWVAPQVKWVVKSKVNK